MGKFIDIDKELLELLNRVKSGDIHPKRIGPERYNLLEAYDVDGWMIAVFVDAGDIDYIEYAITPHGYTMTFEEANAGGLASLFEALVDDGIWSAHTR